MKDLLAWYGLKRFPFDKNIKSAQAMDTEPLKECLARLDYIKRRGGIHSLSRFDVLVKRKAFESIPG